MNNIKVVRFVVPKVKRVKLCLADAIPYLTKPKNTESLLPTQKAVYEEKRKLQWKNWQQKAKANIKLHYEEVKERAKERQTYLKQQQNIQERV